ncbi:MAG: hypothetical protein H6683_00510 [Deltaproteobacteria bacterium]|nr:hypothetical protein [Deltaproteobacteria bacterium]
MGARFWLHLVLTVLMVSTLACGGDDDDDSASDDDVAVDDDTDDDDTSDDDTDDDLCGGEALRCGAGDVPEECVEGVWTPLEPCPRLQYCNFGECVNTLIEFPADEAPHRNLIEWWYWTGNLSDADGNVYGFELTFFYGARLLGIPAWMIHVGIVDEQTGEHDSLVEFSVHFPDETPTELHLATPSASVDRGADYVYELSGVADTHAYDLTLTDTQGPTYHGGNGSIRMSSRTVDSFYYSRMRIDVEGTLYKDGAPIDVTGEAWMDHQWGGFNPFVLIGWDWFSMQFEDGSEIMYFIFRGDEDDPSVVDMALGSYVDPNGDQTILSMHDVEVTPLDSWSSEVTGGVYPLNWNFVVEDLGIDVDITTSVPDQEFPNPMWNYWEGMVRFDGVKEGGPTGGMGFVELSGYAGRPALWKLFEDVWESAKALPLSFDE